MIRMKWDLSNINFQEIESFLGNNPSITYLSSTPVSEIIHAISRSIEEDLVKSLRKTDYFALFADESACEINRGQFFYFMQMATWR